MSSIQTKTQKLEVKVDAEHTGERLDHYLRIVLPEHSRSRIQQLIRTGAIRLGSNTVRPSHTVRTADTISIHLPPPSSTVTLPENLPLEVVYEDTDLIIVNKPAGMVVHPSPGHDSGTLVNALLHHVSDLSGIGGERRPGIVHRLDRGTSGLIVVAKHDSAHNKLARDFRERKIQKDYIALAWGLVHAGRRIDLMIGRDPIQRQRMSTRARRARTAVTRITQAKKLLGVTLLRVAIATGRTHQIRVHLKAIGHPIVGDSTYGGVHRRVPHNLRPVLKLTRPFLHATRLAFAHPNDGQEVSFEVPLPTDLQQVLNELETLQKEN